MAPKMKIRLFGQEVDELRETGASFPVLSVVDDAVPEVIVCYGGDGTLLSAERQWPGVPKLPIRNSRKGHRCIPKDPHDVLLGLVDGTLHRGQFMKLECVVEGAAHPEPVPLMAMNEFNLRNKHVNAAVRFRVWLDDEPYGQEDEIIGDGLIVATPFGSTAYFKNITHAVFHLGIGIAFVNTGEAVSHMIVPEDMVVRIEVTRSPAVLAFDNSTHYADLVEGSMLTIRRDACPATILAWNSGRIPSDCS